MVQEKAVSGSGKTEADKSTEDKKVALPELQEHMGEAGLREKKYELFSDFEVSLDAVVGEVALTVSALMAKKQGEIIRLNESVDAPVKLKMHGKVIATGQLVVQEDSFAFKIESIETEQPQD